MKHRLRHRYGRSTVAGAFKPTLSSGKRVAFSPAHSPTLAFVTHEPDGLYYSWADRGGSKQDWYFGFKSKKEAIGHMLLLAGQMP
jgi:hypothetical protein